MMEDSYKKLNEPDMENSGGTVEALSGPVKHSGSALDFLERTALDAQLQL